MTVTFKISHLGGGGETVSLSLEEARAAVEDLLGELDRDADEEHYQVHVATSNEGITAIEGGLLVYSSTSGTLYCRPRDLADGVDILVSFVQGASVQDRFQAGMPPPSESAGMSLPLSRHSLHLAASRNLRLVRRLVEAGRDVNERDESGGTPLMIAAIEGNICWSTVPTRPFRIARGSL